MFTKAQVFMVGDRLVVTVLALLVAWWCLAGVRRMWLAARERELGPALARFVASVAAFTFLLGAKGLIIPADYRLRNWLDWAATLSEWAREDVAMPALAVSSAVAVGILLVTLHRSTRAVPVLDEPVVAAGIPR